MKDYLFNWHLQFNILFLFHLRTTYFESVHLSQCKLEGGEEAQGRDHSPDTQPAPGADKIEKTAGTKERREGAGSQRGAARVEESGRWRARGCDGNGCGIGVVVVVWWAWCSGEFSMEFEWEWSGPRVKVGVGVFTLRGGR